ncbi:MULTISPECIES: RNA-binding S4 domain-containing protein [unclassified Fusibacter]|uniref:RNA-binding S4 domain-containing protein n=1 Tax=unclassified Fusibacter TaxID=2624464 RepID=UPI0010101816|nr:MULTISPECIES: RNA-binding S4 domain-containing protein [unclassified Fusibacter]MCK8059526.1 RNA-binding S4 domain-containing protein [Fusibacter sp. A2]NPE21010.1 RNA-binding S4 domain-containing protein [Fusibacter sp. A1]RXV62284.1 RNA-binding S4 domain-containing protein [Fusibacter sp. A1]
MRLDKYLKTSRIIKRRTIAKDACDQGRIMVNDMVAKAGHVVKLGDIITITFGNRTSKYEVLSLSEHVKKEEALEMYKQLQ